MIIDVIIMLLSISGVGILLSFISGVGIMLLFVSGISMMLLSVPGVGIMLLDCDWSGDNCTLYICEIAWKTTSNANILQWTALFEL